MPLSLGCYQTIVHHYLSLQINIHHHNLVSHIVSSFLMHLARAQTHRNIYTISSDMADLYLSIMILIAIYSFIFGRKRTSFCNSKVMLMGGGSNLILSISQTRRIDATSHNHNTIFVFTGIYPKVNWVGRSVPPPPVSRRGEDILLQILYLLERNHLTIKKSARHI